MVIIKGRALNAGGELNAPVYESNESAPGAGKKAKQEKEKRRLARRKLEAEAAGLPVKQRVRPGRKGEGRAAAGVGGGAGWGSGGLELGFQNLLNASVSGGGACGGGNQRKGKGCGQRRDESSAGGAGGAPGTSERRAGMTPEERNADNRACKERKKLAAANKKASAGGGGFGLSVGQLNALRNQGGGGRPTAAGGGAKKKKGGGGQPQLALNQGPEEPLSLEIEAQLDEWVQCKMDQDYERADEIRDELRAMGINPAKKRPNPNQGQDGSSNRRATMTPEERAEDNRRSKALKKAASQRLAGQQGLMVASQPGLPGTSGRKSEARANMTPEERSAQNRADKESWILAPETIHFFDCSAKQF